MGDLILNGRRYSGLIDAQGIFIDTDNVIYEDAFRGSMTYIATRDCFIRLYIVLGTGATYVDIDGVHIYTFYNNNTIGDSAIVCLKKGQTISVINANTDTNSGYSVYGIQTGDNVTFLSEYASTCYDTNEREVGCWVDGKPIYKKTFRFNSTILLTANEWTNGINVDTSNMETFVDFEVIRTVGAYATYGYLQLVPSNGLLNIFNTRNLAVEVDTITLLYTKTTDTPGSGKLTPTAMPTVHYSTDEKVIGTWINGKPIYEKTYELSTLLLVANNEWTNTTIDSSNIQTVIDAKGYNADGTFYGTVMADPTRSNHTLLGLQTARNNNTANIKVLVIQYTKTT